MDSEINEERAVALTKDMINLLVEKMCGCFEAEAEVVEFNKCE